jgi:hypothetical protein
MPKVRRGLKVTHLTIDIPTHRSITTSTESIRQAVSHVMQGRHLADRVEISTFVPADGFFIFLTPGGVSERDFETGRALYF